MALALALIGLAEVGLRAVEPRLSVDIQHHQTFDQRAQRLAASDGLRVAVVGNSMVRRGLDAEAWVASSQQAGAPQLSVEQFHPDDAGIGDWPWLLHRVFAARDRVPDVFILCMGPWVMGDDAEVHPTRILELGVGTTGGDFGGEIGFGHGFGDGAEESRNGRRWLRPSILTDPRPI